MSTAQPEFTVDDLVASRRVTITRAETARLLGIDPRTVSQAIDRGEIPARTYGRRVLVLVAPLLQQLGVATGGDA